MTERLEGIISDQGWFPDGEAPPPARPAPSEGRLPAAPAPASDSNPSKTSDEDWADALEGLQADPVQQGATGEGWGDL